MTFSTFEDLKKEYYKSHKRKSDDDLSEENMILYWMEDNRHVILEENVPR